MITVGFIDTDSHTEKLFSIFIMLILNCVFAYSINSVGTIIQDMSKEEKELKF